MKKILCGVLVMVAIMLFGCSKLTPEEVAQEYVKKQFASDYGGKLHTSNLTYKKVKEGEKNATVNVSGNIFYEEDIELVKDGNKWVIRSEVAPTEAVAAVPEPEPEAKPAAAPTETVTAKPEPEAEPAAAPTEAVAAEPEAKPEAETADVAGH